MDIYCEGINHMLTGGLDVGDEGKGKVSGLNNCMKWNTFQWVTREGEVCWEPLIGMKCLVKAMWCLRCLRDVKLVTMFTSLETTRHNLSAYLEWYLKIC